MGWSRKDIISDIKKHKYRLFVDGRYIEHDSPEIDELSYWVLRRAYISRRHNIYMSTGGHGHGGAVYRTSSDYIPPDSMTT